MAWKAQRACHGENCGLPSNMLDHLRALRAEKSATQRNQDATVRAGRKRRPASAGVPNCRGGRQHNQRLRIRSEHSAGK